jgi:hypothetical protein
LFQVTPQPSQSSAKSLDDQWFLHISNDQLYTVEASNFARHENFANLLARFVAFFLGEFSLKIE